jgi:hypothetical protein
MPDLNYPLIAEILQAIQDQPDKHDQDTWMTVSHETLVQMSNEGFTVELGLDSLLVPDDVCGTSACIAGWAVMLSGYKAISKGGRTIRDFRSPEGFFFDDYSIAAEAGKLIGLDKDGIEQIFHDYTDDEAKAQLMFLYEKGRIPKITVDSPFGTAIHDTVEFEDYDLYIEGQPQADFTEEWFQRLNNTFPPQKPTKKEKSNA